MEWVNANERFPIDGDPSSLNNVTFRLKESKSPITNIWAFHEHNIELELGESIYYNQIEWLDESPKQ